MPTGKIHILPVLLFVALLAIGLMSAAPRAAVASSTVHGDVYDWSSFETLDNAQVYVNSVPQQVMVTRNGSYSFDLDKGTYTIVATYGENTSDTLMAMENVTIDQDGGDYVIDLILFPASNFDNLDLLDENSTPIVSIAPFDNQTLPTATPPPQGSPQQSPPQQGQNTGWTIYLAAAVVIIILIAGAGAYLFRRKKPPAAPPENKVPEPPQPGEETHVITETPAQQESEPPLPPLPPSASTDATLPDDLREVIRIIEKNGGRITQLDLRKSLPYSEAKVSLMITDLENRGIVKKIKKGRGNVLILNRPDDR